MMGAKLVKKAAGVLALLVVKSDKVESCPYCLASKVVGNGVKSSGAQNYLCKGCGKQFQKDYLYWGADKKVKDKILPLLLRGSGVRDTAVVLGISVNCVLRHLVKEAGSGDKTKARPLSQRTD